MEIVYASDDSWRDVPEGSVRAMLVHYNALTYAGTPNIQIREKRTKEIIIDGQLNVLVLANKKDVWINGSGFANANDHYYYIDFQRDTLIREGQYEWRAYVKSKYLDNGFNYYDFITGSKIEDCKLQPIYQIDAATKTRKMIFDVKNVDKIRFSGIANIEEVIVKTRRDIYKYSYQALVFNTLSTIAGEIEKKIDRGSVEINYKGDPFQYRILLMGEYSNVRQTI